MKYLGEAGLAELVTKMQQYVTTAISNAEQRRHPIGSLEFNVSGDNPATYLGFGTWALWGAGKVPVGVDENDADFDEAEKTGGEKEHTLIREELPSHSVSWYNVIGRGWALGDGGTPQLYTEGNDTVGENQPHNNLQPYITCYMWKRTA